MKNTTPRTPQSYSVSHLLIAVMPFASKTYTEFASPMKTREPNTLTRAVSGISVGIQTDNKLQVKCATFVPFSKVATRNFLCHHSVWAIVITRLPKFILPASFHATCIPFLDQLLLSPTVDMLSETTDVLEVVIGLCMYR